MRRDFLKNQWDALSVDDVLFYQEEDNRNKIFDRDRYTDVPDNAVILYCYASDKSCEALWQLDRENVFCRLCKDFRTCVRKMLHQLEWL